MFIGDILKQRMDMLDTSVEQLSTNSLVGKETILEILSNKVGYEEIDEFELEFISKVLYCTTEFFIDENIRNKDIVNSSLNRGVTNTKTNIIKGKLQQFANDFVFLRDIIKEVESEG